MTNRLSVGNVEIVSVPDMVPPPRAPGEFFPDVPIASWEPYADSVLEEGQVQLYFGAFFLRSGGRTIMVDTGMGPGPHVDRGNVTGDLLNQLSLEGVDLEDVAIVVHTHLHADHVGWNIDRSSGTPRPFFPRARYLVPRLDWEHFTRPENLDSAPQVRDSVMPLEKLGVMELIDGEHAVTDGVTTVATPGHTPGHQAVLVSSQGERAMLVGDVLHSKVQVQEPDWCAGVDVDKPESRRSRSDLLDRAEREEYTVAAGHFHPTEHFGRVVRLQGRRYWQAL